MALSTPSKFRIKENDQLLVFHAPVNFSDIMSPLPKGARVVSRGTNITQVHWFVKNRAQVEKEFSRIRKLVQPGVTCWVYFPKGSSKVQTDLSRDEGWDIFEKQKDLTWLSLVSFDDTWSAFAFRNKSNADEKKKNNATPAGIDQYIDRVKRNITLPPEIEKTLKKEKQAYEFFQSLSFTNRKEYLEWILSAKKEETKTQRIEGMMVRLGKKWKNPRNI